MATGREHFALDWIKSELLETLNDARQALEAYVESDRDETLMRACLTGLHQVHGTLVMLELSGVTLLADHLERVAQLMLNGAIEDEAPPAQSVMQGILELPGHIDEIQNGKPDSERSVLQLVNELRVFLGEEAIDSGDDAGSIRGDASDVALKRFEGIDGIDKARKIRAAYQQVLLSILKGDDVAGSVTILSKVAQGLQRVCADTPQESQWQAFGEFVASLENHDGPLDGATVKLLRRVDSAIRELAKDGVKALKNKVSLDLVGQIIDAAEQRGYESSTLDRLRGALTQSGDDDGLAISGRQALASAATALREELVLVKDRLDLIVRAGTDSNSELVELIAPLKQIGSTLSLLGFESSRAIVADQIEALNQICEADVVEQSQMLSIASALVQVDENLASFTHGGKGEVEQITDDAQRAVASEARAGLDNVKQDIVDFISSQWDPRHLKNSSGVLAGICGALTIIPLTRAARLLAACSRYIDDSLVAGPQPSWETMDHLADAISGVDYYLERVAGDSSVGAEDILDLVEGSLGELGLEAGAEVSVDLADADSAAVQAQVPEEVAAADPVQDVVDAHEAAHGAVEETTEADAEEKVADSAEIEEPKLAMDNDAGFDLSSDVFEDLVVSSETRDAEDAEVSNDEVSNDGISDEEVPVADPAVAEVAAEPMQSTPVTPNKPTLADTFETDAEIIEIFVEEVAEVLATIDEWLPQLLPELTHEEALSEVRRAFHTLKGSGRIVGANVIGEMAWSIENMLNRLIDGTVEATAQFVAVVQEARDLAPSLQAAFESQSLPEMEALGRVMERADVLASGGTLDDGQVVQEVASAGASADTSQAPAEAAGSDTEPLAIFIPEARSHLDVLQHCVTDAGVDLNEECLRAIHTLSGSASMAGIAPIADLAVPMYELAQALCITENRLVDGDNADFFRAAIAGLVRAVENLRAGNATEDHHQLIADADHLLVAAAQIAEDAPPSAREVLMGLSGLSVVMEAPEFLTAWQQGAMDLEFSEQLIAALVELEKAAAATERPAIGQLGSALRAAHEHLAHDLLSQENLTVLQAGHDHLMAMFDALAADQATADASDLIVQLSALLEAPIAADQDVADSQVAAAQPEREALAEADSDNVVAFPQDFDGEDPAVEQQDKSAVSPPEEIGLEGVPADLIGELTEDITVGRQIPASAAQAMRETPEKPTEVERDPALAELLSEDFDEEIIEIFFEEADEILESLEENIHQWSSEPANLLFLEHLLRGLHTLKGGARLSGLVRLGDATHQFESFLVEIQNQEKAVDESFFNDVHVRLDELVDDLSVVRKIVAGEHVEGAAEILAGPAAATPGSADAEVDPQRPAAAPTASKSASKEPPAGKVAAKKEPAPAKKDTKKTATVKLAAESTPEAAAKTDTPDAVGAEPRSGQEMVRVGSGLLENLVNLAGESSIVRARVEQGMNDFTNALDEMETTIGRVREQLRRLEIETEAQILFRQDRPDGPTYDQFDPLEMDRYSQLQQLSRGLSESASDMMDLKETLLFKARESETLLLQQARINTELQEGLMRTRMVPFSRLLPRLRRIVRQVSTELEKDVEFHAYNAEGELDRNLLERMVPPLEHMLRNAVDHGIESREMRKNFGKTPAGRIDLLLSREGGDVVIEISDDGAGIDVETVRAKAVESGLMAADADLRDDEICQFVLAPGFSTAKSVTQISGRGVGMDVVHSEVKQLGGSIQIASIAGKGSRFIVRVPFTVSVNRALMVSVGDDLYAIPLNTIEGIVLLSPNELEKLYTPDENTFEYAGIPYRVRYLGHYLGREFKASAQQSSVPVVLVRSGDQAVAVHVDGVQGSREIVVKSLGPQFAGVGGISGATILGDGSVVVIIDLIALIRAQSGDGLASGARPLARGAKTTCVMVVDDSVTVRKVTSRLLERQGMDVIIAKDGIEAIALLQERRPDVMLLDIEMPRMDGFEVARQVRHDDRLSDLPIIMISSRTGEKHQEHAAQLGVNSFLGKPFQENELLETIDHLVN